MFSLEFNSDTCFSLYFAQSLPSDLSLESYHHQARWAQPRHRDVGGPQELHEDEHLPGQPGPLVLAKAQVFGVISVDWPITSVIQIHAATPKESVRCVLEVWTPGYQFSVYWWILIFIFWRITLKVDQVNIFNWLLWNMQKLIEIVFYIVLFVFSFCDVFVVHIKY